MESDTTVKSADFISLVLVTHCLCQGMKPKNQARQKPSGARGFSASNCRNVCNFPT